MSEREAVISTNPYTSQSSSGYNASPPADDGSVVASNQVLWATIKTKLADVLKTFAEAINSAVLSAFSHTINIDNNENNQMGGSLAFAVSTLTLSSDTITPTRSFHLVDTEAAAATDTLSTISTASVSDGCVLLLGLANAGRTITVTHEIGGAGQIHLLDENNFALNSTSKTVALQRRSTDWYQIADNRKGVLVQRVKSTDGAVATGTTVMPFEDTIPQNTEGDQYMSLAITPKNTANRLLITAVLNFGGNAAAGNHFCAALFQDSTASSLYAVAIGQPFVSAQLQLTLEHEMAAGTTSATTFKVRIGPSAGSTVTFNGVAAGRIFGGVMLSSLIIEEYLS